MLKRLKLLGDKKFYYAIRRKKDKVIIKIFSPLLKLGVNADMITSAGLLSGIISIKFLGTSQDLFLSFWGFSKMMDVVDGAVFRYNKKTWFKNLNLDKYADIAYDTLLTFAVIPYTGIWLVVISFLARILNLKLDGKNWGSNLLAPHCAFTHSFFIFRMFQQGLLFQTIYSISVPLAKKLYVKVHAR
jgi:hypothetical protein